MCEEESEDAEAVNKLLEINDSIHRTIERYKLMKAGNITAANSIAKGTLGTTTGVGRNSANELSLIDFDPEPESAPQTSQKSSQPASNGSLLEDLGPPSSSNKQTTVEDDLLGLSLGGPGSTGSIALGGPASSDFFGNTSSSSRPQQPSQPAFMSPSPAIPQATKPNYDAFASLSSALPRSKPATPTPGQQRPVQSQAASVDPFAALVSSGSRPSTPSAQQNGRPASGAFKPIGMASMAAAPAASTNAAPSTTDDDWDFVSSPPAQEPAMPTKSTFVAHDSGKLKVTFECMRQTNGTQPIQPIYVRASFTNLTSTPISALNFQVAVEKAYSLQLQPQSGKSLPPQQPNAVTQNMLVQNVPQGKGTSVRIRFKAYYVLGSAQQEEQGMISSLEIA